MKYISD